MPNEFARTRATEGVRGLVAFDQIRFTLDHDPGATSPDELRPDKVRGACKWIDLKELC
jgi:hypothetical protein